MKRHLHSDSQLLALVAAALGFVLILRWIFQIDVIERWIPGAEEMGLNAPILLLVNGVCLFLLSAESNLHRPRQWLFKVGAAISIVIPVVILLQQLFNISLGIDWIRAHEIPTVNRPHPGRISPNATAAFLLIGVALWSTYWKDRGRRFQLLAIGSVCSVLVISLAGIFGYFLKLDLLYRFGSYNRMLLPTAIGLAVLSCGIFFFLQRISDKDASIDRHREQIAQRSIVTLTIVALLAALAGFAMMRDQFEESLAASISLTATTNEALIEHTIETALWFPRTISTSPLVLESIKALEKHPNNSKLRTSLQKVGDSFMTAGVTSVIFTDSQGALLATSGVTQNSNILVSHTLPLQNEQVTLLWNKHYWLRTRANIVEADKIIGTVTTEQPLQGIDRSLSTIREGSDTSDAVLCNKEGAVALCAPSRFYNTPQRIPMYQSDGTVNLPINHALLGQEGVMSVRDLRGVRVLAAYVPLKKFGLGLVVKTDMNTLYASMKHRMLYLAAILALLVTSARYALRIQIQPLLGYIMREQKRMKIILQNSNDAFVALDADGIVTDWNTQAEKTFGWQTHEAIGRTMTDLLYPAEQKAIHDAGFKQFQKTGTGSVINQRIQVIALHKDGHLIPVEMSFAAYHNGESYISTAFLHDITERKLAEEKLTASEKRLRTITDNLPALISYIDKEERLTFINGAFKTWLGAEPDFFIGKTMQEAFSGAIYEERKAYLEQALAGHRVEFDMESTVLGTTRYLQSVYIPDKQEDGTIAGVYTLSFDVTALKRSERELARLARFDSLTGLPNRYQFNEKLVEAMSRCRRSNMAMAIMFLDIDHFKGINDSLGHGTGDEVLKEFAQRLKSSVRETDTVARLGGDEFIIILESLHTAEEPQFVARKIIASVTKPIQLEQTAFEISSSIGIVFFRGEHGSPEELLEQADKALYQVKEAGRNSYKLEIYQSRNPNAESASLPHRMGTLKL